MRMSDIRCSDKQERRFCLYNLDIKKKFKEKISGPQICKHEKSFNFL